MSGSSPGMDHNRYRSWPRREHAGFVKSIRRTSSQLFKKDRDVTPRNSPSAISALLSEALSISTAHTTPNTLRGFSRSYSKRSGVASVITVNWDPPENRLEVKVGGGERIHSPIVEVTPASPTIAESLDSVPTSPLEETSEEESMLPETVPEGPDPLSLPLPPSPPCPPSPLMDLVDPVQSPENSQEADPLFHYDDPPLPDHWSVTSSSCHLRLPTAADIALTTPPPDRTVQPSLTQPPPSAPAAPTPNRDEDEEIPEPYILPLTAPTTSSPIPNACLSYFLEPVVTWWLSKDISSYPYLYF